MLGLLAGALALELALQPLPVHRGIEFQPVDAANPVLRGVPGRAFTHSVGWSLFNPRSGRLNNLGFNDPQAYDASRPVTAVLGDSYVEAQAVPYASALQARLRAVAGACPHVYGFGVSGAAASDYPAYLAWARARFDVRQAVVVVTTSDLEESTGPRPGMHHFARRPDGSVELVRTDRPAASPLTRALNRSKLYRYVFGNLGFDPVGRARALLAPAEPEDDAPAPDQGWTVPALLDALTAQLPPQRITLVVDADREALAAGQPPEHPPERARLIAEARRRGFVVADLEAPVRAWTAAGGAPLDFAPLDGHWNPAGHRLAADALAAAWRDQGQACGS